jgi:hypothetical protein
VKAAEGESTTQEESFDEISDVVASEIVQVMNFHSSSNTHTHALSFSLSHFLVLQLTSLILEYSFANFKSPEVQQTLYESSHVVSQVPIFFNTLSYIVLLPFFCVFFDTFTLT